MDKLRPFYLFFFVSTSTPSSFFVSRPSVAAIGPKLFSLRLECSLHDGVLVWGKARGAGADCKAEGAIGDDDDNDEAVGTKEKTPT